MVVPSRLRYWTLLLTLVFVFTLYITLINLTISQDNTQNYGSRIKKVVAYSLLKQIDRISEEVQCVFKDSEISKDKNYTKNQGYTWEQVKYSNVYIYSVYKDVRLDPYKFVRIIAMVKGFLNSTIYCQIRNQDDQIYVAKANPDNIWSEEWDTNSTFEYFNPVLFTCRIPLNIYPKYVSVTTAACELDSENKKYLLNYEETNKRMFTVCIKPLNFNEDITKKLIQWIEINRILGAERIEFYVGKIKRRTQKILKWYANSYPDEVVTTTFREINEKQFKLPPIFESITEEYANYIWQKRRYEVIVYNDCFYRNLHTSQFIIPLDIDEIIIPSKVKTWKQLLQETFRTFPGLENTVASLSVSNAYYFQESNRTQDKKELVYFFHDVTRSELSQNGESCKSFISTKNSLKVFNHYTLDVLKPGISRVFFLPNDMVQMNHYRVNCSAVILPECMKYLSSHIRIEDKNIFKYKNQFYVHYNEVLKASQFLL